jgi:hypothetical protein
MENMNSYLDDLKTIREVMEKSSRFLSLRGISGVLTGLFAIAGAFFAVFVFMNGRIMTNAALIEGISIQEIDTMKKGLFAEALILLGLATAVSWFFSYRESARRGEGIWSPVSKRFLLNFLVPLVTGGIFILILYLQGKWQLVLPSMLIFYGLALVNAGKFTFGEIFYLGLLEIALGLLATIIPGLGMVFWVIGFGVLHVVYGLIMKRKYGR